MPANTRTGTGFQNLNAYLGLNRGAAQGMADTLSEEVNNRGQSFNTALGTAGAGLTEQLTRAGNLGVTNPSGVTGQQAAELGARQWSGPEGFDAATVNDLYGKAQAAQNAANATGTNEGRQTLLAQKYGQTTWGGGALDAALAGAGDASGSMSKARGAYGRLLESLPGIQQNARDMAGNARKGFEQQTAYWRGMAPERQKAQDDAAAYNREFQRQNRNKYTGGGWKNTRGENRPERDAGAAYTP